MSRATETMERWATRMPDIERVTNAAMAFLKLGRTDPDIIWAFMALGAIAWTQAESGWTEQDMHELVKMIWDVDPEPGEPEGASA